MLRHQATTWELLHVLFSAIDGEQPLYRAAGGGADGGGGEGNGAPANGAAGMGDGEEVELDRLAAFKRRAHMSHWLRDRARPHVEATLRSSGGSNGSDGGSSSSMGASDAIAGQLLALLSGRQMAAAAALAAVTGNPRLASLLAQAGTKAVGQAELADQLAVWETKGYEPYISKAMRRVYQLLAGQVDAVTPSMQASHWAAGCCRQQH